jgi:hypothetical protein
MMRALLLVAIGTLAASGPWPASADPTHGPFQVMGPDGAVVRISTQAAEAWWKDYHHSRCVTCRGPDQAAELLDAVENALGGRFHGGPRYLILVESLRSTWPRAWIFYPSSDETPAYVMKPGGVGSGVAPLRWDAWYPATSRMERIILEATGAAVSPAVAGAVEETRRDGLAPVAWIAVSAALAALLASLAVARRRMRRSARATSAPSQPTARR